MILLGELKHYSLPLKQDKECKPVLFAYVVCVLSTKIALKCYPTFSEMWWFVKTLENNFSFHGNQMHKKHTRSICNVPKNCFLGNM